ncbi:phosphoglycolate phosphatase (plasmid) [Pseudorhodobacter turbinis]|uniref:Phosphoglycolate phosphatase n=1 Tax=Pseudorhodobacter turbinis TaxID=2500533 RepID=A0A4P8EJM7_9RHOB|nr:phosphoglycolate phosphatase [Pseudorhodobacter turbinis]QCO57179.1 phosphoglycolate phosphatase [Pseudorhodobacter turbinis]
MIAVIFDLDGTLIDSAPDIVANTNAVLQELGLGVLPPAQIKGFIGKGVGHLLHCVLEASGQVPDGPLHAPMQARFNQRYETAFEMTVIYPGVVKALDQLVEMGCALGICTNKPIAPTHAVLRHLGLAEYFPVVYGGDSLAVRKPDPAPLLAAVKDLGRDRVIYVGDSEVDAATADAAKLPFLIYTEGYRKTPVHDLPHDAAFNDFRQLPGLVGNLMKG